MNAPVLFLGVDGGGTRTRAVIVNAAGDILGLGVAGPGNFDDLGEAVAQSNLDAAVRAAELEAGGQENSRPFTAAFLGLAGTVSDADRGVVSAMAANLKLAPAIRTGVDHDIRIALAGGLAGRPGIALVIGTGSSCYGRDSRGRFARAGGWGHLIGDEGSGYWLGVSAIRAVARAADGRDPPTALSAPILAALGIEKPDDLLHRLYVTGLSRPQLAALAPIVLQAAASGDPASLAFLETGGRRLAECVAAVAARLEFPSGVEVTPVGGLASAGARVLGPLESALAQRLPKARLRAPALPPVLGAALLAAELAGVSGDGFVGRLRAAGLARGLSA